MLQYPEAVQEPDCTFLSPLRGLHQPSLLSRFTAWAVFFRRFAAWQRIHPGVSIHSIYSIVAVIFAVFSSIAETEQYFCLESLTASSIAFCDILPLTRYVSLMWV